MCPEQIGQMRAASFRIPRSLARVFGLDLAVGDFGVPRPVAPAFNETARRH